MSREWWIPAMRGYVERLADKEYQERAWVRGEGPECDSSEEAMWGFFEDSAIDAVFNEQDPNIKLRPAEKAALTGLYDVVETLADRHDWQEPASKILADPAWREVRARAREALEVLDTPE